MDRLSQGQLIAAGSALLLLLSLFLPWVGLDVEGASSTSLSGWESNNTLDIYLLILAGFALIPALVSMGGSNEELPLVNNAATFLLGAIGTVMTVYVFLDPGYGGLAGTGVEFGREIGLILATLAVIGVTVGAYLAMQDEVGSEY